MKKLLLLFALASSLFAQNVIVEKITKVNTDGQYFLPKFSPDDSALLLTSENYKGLYLLDLKTSKVKTVTTENGAGFKAKFDYSGNKIFFRTFKFVEGKKYSSEKIFDLLENKTLTLISDERNLTPPIQSFDGSVYCFQNGEVKEIEKSLMKNSSADKSVFIRNSLIVYREGEKEKVLKPFGEGIYVWPSLSPDGNYILFTFGSKGSFVMDTEGNVLKALGDLHYPHFSPDGKWVVGMNDKDDGYKFVSSDILIVNLRNLKKFNITDSPEKIEMYPEWSHSGNEVTFHDLQGNIYIVKLSLVEE